LAVELKVPAVGESVTEVQIGEWLKQEGQDVAQDEAVVMIETDKVTVELPAPVAGKITQILLKAGQTARVGDVVGYLEPGAPGAVAAAPAEAKLASAAGAPAPSAPAAPAAPAQASGFVMPAAARAMHETGVALENVVPTGPGGRVLKEDVQRASMVPKPPAQVTTPASKPPPSGGGREEDIVPMTTMRKRIAERLVQAQQTAAMLTTFNEVDMTAAMALRKQYQDAFSAKYDIKLGFMSFFVKAAVDALKLFPSVNAEIRDQSIVYKNYFDIGVAVGGGKGLVVPVIRNTERLSFAQIESKIKDLGVRAKANAIKLDELQGGTFTITNGGIYGSLLSTPILNPPQSGILGLHGIQDRPIALNGQVVIRPMMYIALTYDHRLVDGREAVTFLRRIKDTVEDPARMLLEI
jgi:2-oxoglutarate dehydrogenase E2 component (dihydrolipoamide succinyltransferase)